MRLSVTLLFWTACLLAFAFAAPVNGISALNVHQVDILQRDAQNITTPDINVSTETSPETIEATLEGSIQIVFRQVDDKFGWTVFQGPVGIAANPCGDNRFVQPKSSWGAFETRRPISINNPPFPHAGLKWSFEIPPLKDCRYESDPKDESPGWLICGDKSLIYDFSKDPSWDRDGVIECPKIGPIIGTYHRAWYVEY
jgi:hypothetical protein